MIEQMLRALGIDPKQMMGEMKKYGEVIVEFKQQLDRIERKQDLILRHLAIDVDTQRTLENGEERNHHAGQ